MANRGKPVIAVHWSKLLPFGDEPSYRRECPFCEDGIFLVDRSPMTFELEEYDGCVSCGQAVRYIDIEKMRKKEKKDV